MRNKTSLSALDRDVIGYINAGGRGTRLNDLFVPDTDTGIAKALLEIGAPGIRLVDHHIANLRHQGFDRVVVAAGDQVEVYEYIQDIYRRDQGVVATASTHQMGNGGDLANYVRTSEIFTPLLIQNVDTILDINLTEFSDEFISHRRLGATASIALTMNTGVPNERAFAVDASGRVVHSAEFDDGVEVPNNSVDYKASSTGAVVLDPSLLRYYPWSERDGQLSLYRDCLRRSWEKNGLFAYNNGYRFFRDVGTVATWLASQEDEKLQSQLRYNEQTS